MIRILIADDQELVRTGFRVVLDAEPDLEVVGEAADGLAALDAAKTLKPDVVLMDIRMLAAACRRSRGSGSRFGSASTSWCRRSAASDW